MKNRTYFKGILVAGSVLSMLSSALSSFAEAPGKHWMNVGDSVEVDKLQSSTPGLAVWRTGKIIQVNRNSNSYLVDVDGEQLTIINNDNWVKPGAAQADPPGQAGGAQGAAPAGGAAMPAAPGGFGGGARGGGGFAVGSLVKVDKIMASTAGAAMWTVGKVVGINQKNNSIDVLTDDGIRRTIVNSPDWIKPGDAGDTFKAPPANGGNNAGNPGNTGNAGNAGNAGNKANPGANKGTPEWEKRKGLGAPPNGSYIVHKARTYNGGTDIELGRIVIQGNSYSGMDGGGMAPYTMNGDSIVWTNGLNGMPNGWTIISSKYIGADEHGRPLIRIWYRSARSGALDVLDAYRP